MAIGDDARREPAAGSTLTMVVICTAQFVLQLDFSIVNVALPTVQRELGMAPADLQWIVTGYALTFGSLLLAGGRLADLLGRRRLLAVGLAAFGAASLACGLAQWPVMLIVARVAQGAAGAMVSPAALSLLTTTNPEGPARHRALSIWQAVTSGASTAGIVAGGPLTQYLGWRSVFLVNPPIIVALLVALPRLPVTRSGRGGRVDVPGAAAITAAIAALIFGLSSGQQHGFTSAGALTALVAAVVLAMIFVVVERSVAAPMLPLGVLAAPARRTAVAAMLMIGAILAGYVYFISLFLQRVLGYSPVVTGLVLLPSTLTAVLTATLGTRRLLARLSLRQVLIVGLVLIATGQLWMARLTPGSSYPAGVLPGLIITAVGVGLALPSASIAITSGVQARDQGLAGALFTTSQQTGAAIGVAVLATAAAARTAHLVAGRAVLLAPRPATGAAPGPAALAAAQHAAALAAGYRLSFLIGAGIAVLAIATVAVVRPQVPAALPGAAPAQPS